MDKSALTTAPAPETEIEPWLASFYSVLMTDADDPGNRIGRIAELKRTAEVIQERIDPQAPDCSEIEAVFQRAIKQIPSLAEEARRSLPGAPLSSSLSEIEFRSLKTRLLDRESRQELGADGIALPCEVLDEAASPLRLKNAGLLTLLPLLMPLLAAPMFITIPTRTASKHPESTIRIYGIVAIMTLLMVVMSLLIAVQVLEQAAEERVVLDGHNLTLTKRVWKLKRTKKYTLLSTTKPRIGGAGSGAVREGQTSGQAILLTDVNRQEVSFGAGMSAELREELLAKISAYLANHTE